VSLKQETIGKFPVEAHDFSCGSMPPKKARVKIEVKDE